MPRPATTLVRSSSNPSKKPAPRSAGRRCWLLCCIVIHGRPRGVAHQHARSSRKLPAWRCSAISRTSRSACATRSYAQVRHRQGARAAAAQGQHRRQEGLLRLGALQDVQGADARGVVRADRDPARAPVGARTRPTSAWSSTRSTSATRSRTSTRSSSSAAIRISRRWSASCARTTKTVIGVGVKNSTLRPADRELRRVHLLRRPRARQAQGAREEARDESERRERRIRRDDAGADGR